MELLHFFQLLVKVNARMRRRWHGVGGGEFLQEKESHGNSNEEKALRFLKLRG
jgi:hypothetical protein